MKEEKEKEEGEEKEEGVEEEEKEIETEEIEEEGEETMSENGSREEMEEDEEIDFKCICQMSERKIEKWREKIEVRRIVKREPGTKREDVVIPQWPCPCKITKCPNKIGKWTKEKLEKRVLPPWKENPLKQILINQI